MRLLLLLAIMCLVACGIDENPLPPQVAPYIVPYQATVPAYLNFVATTEASLSVSITARTPGYIEKILFKDGDDVTVGQSLYVIESTINRAQVQQARASLDGAEADAEQAKLEYSRYLRLHQQGAASQEALDNARLNKEQADSSVVEAEGELTEAEKTLSYTHITAPFDGRISRTLYDIGNLVGVNGDTQLTTLLTLDPLYIDFNVPSTYLQRLFSLRDLSLHDLSLHDKQTDLPVVFTLKASDMDQPLSFQGMLDFMDNRVSTTSGTMAMRATVANSDHLLFPGQFGTLLIPVGQHENALLLPQAVVKQDIEGNYIFIVDTNKTLQRKNIVLGDAFHGWVIVKQGIAVADHVISGHLMLMRSGLVVAPQPDTNFPIPAALHQFSSPTQPSSTTSSSAGH